MAACNKVSCLSLFYKGREKKKTKVVEPMEAAVQRWGRNNLFDWPTKIPVVVDKTDASSLGYVVGALYAQMWRKNAMDPCGVSELKKVVYEDQSSSSTKASAFIVADEELTQKFDVSLLADTIGMW